jgi:hypothetical protein
LQCSRQIEFTATWSYCRAFGLPSSAMASTVKRFSLFFLCGKA